MEKNSVNQRFIDCVNYLVNSRIVKYRADIQRELNIKASRFSEIMNGRMNVAIDVIAEFCKKYGISVTYIVLGDGDMVIDDNSYLSKLQAQPIQYNSEENLTNKYLNDKNEHFIENLNTMLADKNKIIQLQDERISHLERKVQSLEIQLQKATKTL